MFAAGILVACAAGVAFLLQGPLAASQTPSTGGPLTKEDYFQESLHFMGEESKSERLYYKMSVRDLPHSKCAASAGKYQRMLAHMTDEARPLIPPPEIAEIHMRLLSQAGGIVRKVGRIARQTRNGRWLCGDDLEHPRANEIAARIYRVYRRSGLEPTLQQLRDLGYVPSGE